MKSMKSTKSALVTSMIALLLCVSMLVGTTYAWLTDTASTGVNTIQAGELDVALQKQVGSEWVPAEGGTLEWIKPGGGEVIWGPGCTYQLPTLRVVNKGDLAVKYKLIVKGINLNSAELELWNKLTWCVNNDVEKPLSELAEGNLSAADGENNASETYTISASLPSDLDDKYQNMSIDDVSVILLATQMANEFDSFDDQYDKDALYCALATPVNRTRDIPVTINEQGSINAIINNAESNGVPLGNRTPTGLKASQEPIVTIENRLRNKTGTLHEKITTTGGSDHVTYDISYSFTSDGGDSMDIHGFSSYISHTFQLSKGLQNVVVTHEGNAMTKGKPADATNGNSTYQYDGTTGILTISSYNFSKFEVSFDYGFEAATAGQGYTSLAAAMEAAPASGTVTLLKDIERGTITVDKSLTFDLGGYTVNCTSNSDAAFRVESGKTCTIKNGKIDSPYQGIKNYGTITKLEGLQMTGGGIYNYGTITEINAVELNATYNGIVNGDGNTPSKIDTIRNSAIQSTDHVAVSNSVNGTIDTIEGVTIAAGDEDLNNSITDINKNAIVNKGTIGSIQGYTNTDNTVRRTDIFAEVFGILNSGTITTIQETDIRTAENENGVGIINGSGNTINTISNVTVTAAIGIKNPGEITTVSGAAIQATKNGIINSGTIDTIENPTINAATAISNSGNIGTISRTADKGTLTTTGCAILNSKTIEGISNIKITSDYYGISNDNSAATITTIESVEIVAVGIGIRNKGTIGSITGGKIMVSNGNDGNGDYGIYNDSRGTVGDTSGVTFEGCNTEVNSSAPSTDPAEATSAE